MHLGGRRDGTRGRRPLRGQEQRRPRPGLDEPTNHPLVTVAEPGRAFPVSRTEKGAGTIVWRYDLEPHPEGTLVRQSYEVTSPVKRLGWFIIGTLYGLKDRRGGLRDNMQQSLARIAELAEAAESDVPRRSTP